MILRFSSLTLAALSLTAGCRAADPAPSVVRAPLSHGKRGTEQTEGPGVKSQDVRYPTPARLSAQPTVALQPGDLITSTSSTPLRLIVDNEGAAVGDVLLKKLAKGAQLLTFPEMQPVAAHTLLHDVTGPTADGLGQSPFAYVDVVPDNPLQDRWYVLTAALPDGARWRPFTTLYDAGNGTKGARFATGSSATVRRVQLCRETGGVGVVLVEFSERVATAQAGSAIEIATAAGDALACVPALTSSDSGTAEVIRFECTSLPANRPLRVETRLGPLAIDATRAVGLPGLGDTVSLMVGAGAGAAWGDNCASSQP